MADLAISAGRLEGKVAVITGAASGIGRGIAERFAAEGAAIVLADADRREGRAAAEAVVAASGAAVFAPGDVADPGAARALVRTALERFERLDVLVNNAGVMPGGAIEEQTIADWDRTIAVNLGGVFHCTRAAIPSLRETTGTVINIASPTGILGYGGLAAYSASKGGVLALTRAMALDLAPSIRVNAVIPGTIDTGILRRYLDGVPDRRAALSEFERQHPMGRIGTPADVAAGALFLASDDARWVTGSSLCVDGGLTIAKGNPG